jgi:DNA-binding LacI/PurR family transcriptional regulator
MRQLDYRPNPAARALVTGRSHTLGVVSFDTTLYGPASTVLGIERAAHDAGYFIIVASVKDLDRTSISEAVERLRIHGVDGILVIAPQQDAAEALVHVPGAIPLVAVEAGPPDALPVVTVDQFAGAARATRHLLDLGHQTVWHIAGPEDWLEARQRLDGWRSTLADAGVKPPPPLVGDWSPKAGYELGRQLGRDRAVSAIFVANDQMALGVLRALHEDGRNVPGEVSVVGFDDVPEAPYFSPPLTTVRQDFDEIGSRSLRLLLAMIASPHRPPALGPLEPELIIRASTAAAAGARAPARDGGAALRRDGAAPTLRRARRVDSVQM